ncbi:hypothetical protein GF391_01440 [Candidatus Uhrbacteria bacterium]|nr:hypothetical protein [Candidatus Uhrbacteria bacterium]
MKKILIITGILTAILIILLALLAVAMRWELTYDSPRLNENITTATSLPYGTIMGSLSYPSDFLPQLETCAVNIDTQESYCTYQMIQGPNFTYNYGYQLQVPPGSYQVYSKINDEYEPYRAYYSKFITCGGESTCTDHTPITIQVNADETLRDIDPGDWYAGI